MHNTQRYFSLRVLLRKLLIQSYSHSRWAFYLLILLGVLTTSCSNNTSSLTPYGEVFSKIMLSDSGLVRGISLNDSYEKVKSIDTKNLKETGNDDGIEFLFYEFSLSDSGEYYTIAYYFNNTKVSSIELDIYTNTESASEELFNSFTTYFDQKYGTATKEGEFLIWSDIRNKKVKIVAADESATYRKGKLTFMFQDANL